MKSNVNIGVVYPTEAYGPVMYMGTVTLNGHEGDVHKFTPTYGKPKYIQPEELKFFLDNKTEE